MKNTLLVIVVLLVGSCAATPTMKSVAGAYERKKDGNTFRVGLLENGVSKGYDNDKKVEDKGKWSISKDGEIIDKSEDGKIYVLRINKDGSITGPIADIDKSGKRIDRPKERQWLWEKSNN